MLKRQPLRDLTPGLPQHQGLWPQGPTWVMHLPWTHSQTQASQQGRVWSGQAQACVPRTPRTQDTQGEADCMLGHASSLRDGDMEEQQSLRQLSLVKQQLTKQNESLLCDSLP